MLRWLTCLIICSTLTGCSPALDPAETSLLYKIAQDIEGIRDRHPQLAGFSASEADTRKTYFSHLTKENDEALIMNSSVYWFKVSLTEKAVDMMDAPPPVLSVEIPAFKKHLHLRVRGKDTTLTQALAAIVLQNGEAVGGIQRAYQPENAIEQLSRARGKGRHLV